MRFLIRPADFKDREDLLILARQFPLCSLPPHKSRLEKKIEISRESFEHKLPKKNRNYIFVLEDKKEKKVIGSSQILSYFGKNQSLCYFIKKTAGQRYLQLKRMKAGRHQIGGLILHSDYRKSKALLGLQISMVRFLYIKSFPKEFSPLIEVSLTAPIKNRENDFWRETGQKHLKMSYAEALKNFQADRPLFLSRFPKNLTIKLNALGPKAQSCMEQVHPQTAPVYKGLVKRGFYKTKHYHVMDGGIYLEALWKELTFLKKAKRGVLKKETAQDFFPILLSQSVGKDFFCFQIEGRMKNRKWFVKKIPKGFEEGRPALALPFPS